MFDGMFRRIVCSLPMKTVFEKGNAVWRNVIKSVIKQHTARKQSSTKLTPLQAYIKKKEYYAYQNLLCKRKKEKAELRLSHLIRSANKLELQASFNYRNFYWQITNLGCKRFIWKVWRNFVEGIRFNNGLKQGFYEDFKGWKNQNVFDRHR